MSRQGSGSSSQQSRPQLIGFEQPKHRGDSKGRGMTFTLALGVGGGAGVERSQDDLTAPVAGQTGGEGSPRAKVRCQAGPAAQHSSCSLVVIFHGAAQTFQPPLL